MAASASASTSYSTAAHSTNNYCYDVFINHRGPDVKKTFASHLYRRLLSHGLTAFLDQEELQVGLNFDPQIKDAIRTASVHVAVFSPTYAQSEWCLKELVLMMQSKAPIIAVFHKVKPEEVRHTRGEGNYAQALQSLERKRNHDSQPRHDSSTIENWRNALFHVAGMSGLELEAFNHDEGVLVDKVVESVLKFRTPQLYVAKHPTGLVEKVEDLENAVLSQQQNGRAGITGLGGVGKTTLALALFNKKRPKYSKSYFLSDVREQAKNSLPSLQMELLKGLFQLKDLHINNRYQGTEMLRKHISSSKVLIVLDDVDDVDQVDALVPVDVVGHDSLILITSRDKDALTRSGVHGSSIYTLRGLDTIRSTELFCLHAFCQRNPLSGFKTLAHKFVSACHGLPLSLKVIGGLLYGNNDKEYWEDELKRLEEILPEEIQKRLRISYDALQRDEQQIFLDIACFFIGENRDTAIRIWDGSGWQGSRGFRSLLNKCLVELDTDTETLPEIEKRFRISYDALQRDEQQIFLEIAFYFIGENRDTAITIWDGSLQGSRVFRSLLNKCQDRRRFGSLLNNKEKVYKIRMHDHLRDLGRDLAKDSRLPCRLWRWREGVDSSGQGVIDVRGMRMLRSEYVDNAFDSWSKNEEELETVYKIRMHDHLRDLGRDLAKDSQVTENIDDLLQQSSLFARIMVQKWTLCIEVSCYPNPGKANFFYVLYNNASNQVFQQMQDVCGRTTNNEAYYIALIEGLKSAKNYGANDISVFTNSELICNQMKGMYQVKKENLKPLYREARIMAAQFHCFTITHHSNIRRMSTDLLSGAMSTLGRSVEDELASTSILSEFIGRHCYRYPICGRFLVVLVLVLFMVWFFQ